MNYRGYLIYRTRIQRNWSQAGLCKGICSVSYLSKIEAGKTEPSQEILQLLADRLGLKSDKKTEQEAAGLAERGWELLFCGRRAELAELLQGRGHRALSGCSCVAGFGTAFLKSASGCRL